MVLSRLECYSAFSDIAMDLPSRFARFPFQASRGLHSELIRVNQDYLKNNQRKRSVNGPEVKKFSIDEIVLLSYPIRPANNLAGLYRGPMIITSIDRPDIIQVKDLITNKQISMVHTSRLRAFWHPVLVSSWMTSSVLIYFT